MLAKLIRNSLAIFFVAFVVLALSGNNAHAQGAQYTVIYSQPPSPGGGVFKSAWYPPNGLDGDAYVYDGFVLSSNQAISQIRWFGGYTNFLSGAGESPVYDFTISIYPSIAAGTQPDVTAAPLVQYQVGGNAGETAAGTVGGIPMYSYSYVLPSPFQAVAGVKYWLQIEASQGLTPVYYWPPDWGLEAGTGGDGVYFNAITGGTNGGGTLYQIRSGDTAFSLLAVAGPTYSINATANPAGGGTISGAGIYPGGSTVSLTATAAAGYGFRNWTQNGTTVSTSANYQFTATANRTLVAQFVPAFSITTSSSPIFGGSTTGGGVFNSGSTVKVVAKPNLGFVFSNWSVNGTSVSTSSIYTFAAKSNRSLVAKFALGSKTAVFNFDNGTPALSTGQSTPFDQTSRAVSAHFSSPTVGAGGFSVQTDGTTQFHLSQFIGKYLYPNSVYSPALDIRFKQPLTGISFTFATADFHQNETPTTIKLTAYQNLKSNPVGSATAHGTYNGDTMPMGRLTFKSSTSFNLVEITIPPAPAAASDFLMDNVVVVAK